MATFSLLNIAKRNAFFMTEKLVKIGCLTERVSY